MHLNILISFLLPFQYIWANCHLSKICTNCLFSFPDFFNAGQFQSPYVEAPHFAGAQYNYSNFPMPTAPPGAQRHPSTEWRCKKNDIAVGLACSTTLIWCIIYVIGHRGEGFEFSCVGYISVKNSLSHARLHFSGWEGMLAVLYL